MFQTCTKCNLLKPLAHFHLQTRDGKQYRRKSCGVCDRARQAERRVERWEKYKARKGAV